MKNVKLVLTAFAIFAVVGSTLALTARNNPNLMHCISGVCQLPTANPDKYNKTVGAPAANPGNLFDGAIGSSCVGPNPPCQLYTVPTVFRNI